MRRDSFAYVTPILLSLAELNILFGTSRNFIHVVDRKDGTLLSSYRLEDFSYGNEHCNSVLHQDGNIYFVPSEEHGQGTVRLHLSGNGESLTEIWRNSDAIKIKNCSLLIQNPAGSYIRSGPSAEVSFMRTINYSYTARMEQYSCST